VRRPHSRFLVPSLTVALTLTALLVLGLVSVGVLSLANHAVRSAQAKYRAIKPGMTRAEVRKLMRGDAIVMYTDIATAEIMHIDGRFMIAVVYQPNTKHLSSTANPSGPVADDWVAKEKAFVELGRGGRIDDVLVGLGLRPTRVIDREAMTATASSPR
jgi:hypothetical protein